MPGITSAHTDEGNGESSIDMGEVERFWVCSGVVAVMNMRTMCLVCFRCSKKNEGSIRKVGWVRGNWDWVVSVWD